MATQLLINIILVIWIPSVIGFFLEKEKDRHMARKGFILRILAIVVLSLLYGTFFGKLYTPDIQTLINAGVTGFLNIFIFMFGFQRLRHAGMASRSYWLFSVPILNLLFVITLMFLPKKKPAQSEYRS